MTIRTIAISIAIILGAIVNAEARPSEFCGDKYCGYSRGWSDGLDIPRHKRKSYNRHVRHHQHPIAHATKIKAHAVKSKKTIQVASIGNEPLGEHPTGLLAKAKGYLGTNPTGWHSLWCARFIAFIAPQLESALKHMGLNPNWARDYAKLPGKHHDGKKGDIVVLSRGRGGHIGILDHFDKRGNPVIISGNHGHKVGTGTYPKYRVLAYVSS